MSGTVIILVALAGAVGTGALAGLLLLSRRLTWEAIDDDQLQDRVSRGRSSGWASLKPRPHLLTYRRDRRGRFRRHRR